MLKATAGFILKSQSVRSRFVFKMKVKSAQISPKSHKIAFKNQKAQAYRLSLSCLQFGFCRSSTAFKAAELARPSFFFSSGWIFWRQTIVSLGMAFFGLLCKRVSDNGTFWNKMVSFFFSKSLKEEVYGHLLFWDDTKQAWETIIVLVNRLVGDHFDYSVLHHQLWFVMLFRVTD